MVNRGITVIFYLPNFIFRVVLEKNVRWKWAQAYVNLKKRIGSL